MFNDDPFDRIVREFFGNSGFRDDSSNWIKGEEEDRNIDFIQTDDYVYLVFELPGYSEQDVKVDIKGNEINVSAKKSKLKESHGDYVSQKLANGIFINKLLPKFIVPRNFKTTFRNGILELCFKKK